MRRQRFLSRFAMAAVALLGATLPGHAAVTYRYTAGLATMSDGVQLEYTLIEPGGVPIPSGGFPLIVRQHGGGSNMNSEYDRRYGLKYVDTGNFALLMYSHRGHGGSGGIFDFFGPRTTLDLSEMLDWIEGMAVGAEINTDNVGMNGYSQGGGESLLPAMHDARIKAVAVGNTFDDLNHALNPGDCFKFSFATGIFALAYTQTATKTDDLTALRWGAQWNTDTEDVAIPYVDALRHKGTISTTADAASRSPATHVDDTTGFYRVGLHVPTFWSQSWEDSLFPADHGRGILAHLQAQGIPTHSWFASGGHETRETNSADEVGKEAAMLEWFDEFLRGVPHGFASGPRPMVDYAQRIPGGGWTHKTATSWPVSSATKAYYPVASGVLAEGLDGTPPAISGRVVNDIASANIATEPILYYRAGGQMPDQWAMLPDGANPLDTAVFRGPALTADLESTGAPVLDLHYTSTAAHALQVSGKVWDVAPDGSRTLVTRGCGSPPPNLPETSGTATIALWPASHVFPAGHHVELSVAATDFPTFKPDTEPSVTLINVGTKLTLTGVAG